MEVQCKQPNFKLNAYNQTNTFNCLALQWQYELIDG